jgi:hypothetical protein
MQRFLPFANGKVLIEGFPMDANTAPDHTPDQAPLTALGL